MNGELRIKIAEKALSNYIKHARDLGIDLPDTDKFSDAVQQAIMEIIPDQTKKLCPLKPQNYNYECMKEECGWWNGKEKRCAVAVISSHLDELQVRSVVHTSMFPR